MALAVLLSFCYGTSVSERLSITLIRVGLIVQSRRSVYFHRRSRTKQGFFRSNKRIRAIVGVYCACNWSCRCEFGVFTVD